MKKSKKQIKYLVSTTKSLDDIISYIPFNHKIFTNKSVMKRAEYIGNFFMDYYIKLGITSIYLGNYNKSASMITLWYKDLNKRGAYNKPREIIDIFYLVEVKIEEYEIHDKQKQES